jgi:hypothetical protein
LALFSPFECAKLGTGNWVRGFTEEAALAKPRLFSLD